MDRLKEPSTWAGLSGVCGSLAGMLPPNAAPWAAGASMIFGYLAVTLKEKGWR